MAPTKKQLQKQLVHMTKEQFAVQKLVNELQPGLSSDDDVTRLWANSLKTEYLTELKDLILTRIKLLKELRSE